jgi:hypothetical protein
MKKRRKSTIKNWSKTLVVCLTPFRDSGTKTTNTGSKFFEWNGSYLYNFRVQRAWPPEHDTPRVSDNMRPFIFF